MPGPAFNLPASQCITGSKLVDVLNSTCSGCYALKGRYRFKNVQAALNRRLEKLHDPRWIEAMVTLIDNGPVFRWHDSGDVQSVQHLKNIFEVCKQYTGDQPLAAHARSPVPVLNGPGRSSKKFKDSII